MVLVVYDIVGFASFFIMGTFTYGGTTVFLLTTGDIYGYTPLYIKYLPSASCILYIISSFSIIP